MTFAQIRAWRPSVRWRRFLRNPLWVLGTLVVLGLFVAYTVPRTPEVIESRFVLGNGNNKIIGDAVGEATEPKLSEFARGINLLKQQFHALDARVTGTEGKIKSMGQEIGGMHGEIKTLQEQKLDKEEIKKAIEPYLKKIPELMSELETSKREAAQSQVNFPRSSAA